MINVGYASRVTLFDLFSGEELQIVRIIIISIVKMRSRDICQLLWSPPQSNCDHLSTTLLGIVSAYHRINFCMRAGSCSPLFSANVICNPKLTHIMSFHNSLTSHYSVITDSMCDTESVIIAIRKVVPQKSGARTIDCTMNSGPGADPEYSLTGSPARNFM